MKIQIKLAGVYCLLDRNPTYSECYASLKKVLHGDDFIFTKMTPGGDYLQWDLPEGNWLPLSEASEWVAQEVTVVRNLKYQKIKNAFGNNKALADKVLSVPGDDYTYYEIDEHGNVRILLVAWAYKYPEKKDGGMLVDEGRKDDSLNKQRVTICFNDNEHAIPAYEFRIANFNRKTGGDGRFELGVLAIGSRYPIETTNGKKFELVVKEGQPEYTFDITEHSKIKVCAVLDGNPMVGIVCSLCYNGRKEKLITDLSGNAFISLPYKNGEICEVTLNEQTQSKKIQIPQTDFDFVFEKEPDFTNVIIRVIQGELPVGGQHCGIHIGSQKYDGITGDDGVLQQQVMCEGIDKCCVIVDGQTQEKNIQMPVTEFLFQQILPPPSVQDEPEIVVSPPEEIIIEVTVFQHGEKVVGQECSILIQGQRYTGQTDQNGVFAQKTLFEKNRFCKVWVADLQQSKALEKPTTSFFFKLPEAQIEEPVRELIPLILIQGEDGFIGKHYPITVEVDDTVTDYVSDGEGMVRLSMLKEGIEMTIFDKLLPDNIQQYVLQADKEKYVFTIPFLPNEMNKDIKISVKDENKNPVKNASILFAQEGRSNTLSYLEQDAVVYLDKSDYLVKTPFHATLTVNGENYKPITFELEEDENEYVLQAMKPGSNFWLRVLEWVLMLSAVSLLVTIFLVLMDSHF